MSQTRAFIANSATSPLEETTITRREPTASDVEFDVLYCGICHSDLHQARNDWGGASYPLVLGHELVGRVTRVGAAVTKHAVGDLVAVGCLVDSDRTCDECKAGFEQYCPHQVIVFGSPDRHSGGRTMGGFSGRIVVDEHFVLKMPAGLDPAAGAPLLCGGITVYSPLKHWNVGPGQRVGIVGLGGLGHIGVKIARALGAEVVVFTTSEGKRKDALALGASEVIVSRDAEAMKKARGGFDFILDTVSGDHDINPYLGLLRREGHVALVGAPAKPLQVASFALIMGRKSLSGSNIGGIAETQEMLDFCAEKKIVADVEVLPVGQVNEALDRLEKNDVKYRFVLDMAALRA